MGISLFEPLFDKDQCLEQIEECFDKGWTGLGFKTEEFEKAWTDYTCLNNAIFTNSCTSALILAIDCLKHKYGWNAGGEIITTPNTFVSTNHAILHNQLKPVFADIDNTLCLDPKEVEKNISENTKGVMFVGIGGNAGNYKQIVDICKSRGLKLILDASHMAGTMLDGVIPGREADAVCYSFHAVKNLCTADSGMLCFKDDDLDCEGRKKAWLGIDKNTFDRISGSNNYSWEYDVHYLGGKYHGNSVMAAIALSQLPHLDEGNERRRRIAEIYTTSFSPFADRINTVSINNDCLSSSHLYQILIDDRNGLIDYLKSKGIQSGVHYISNTRYSIYSYASGSCPNAEYVSDHVISLPIHLRLSDEEVAYVSNCVIDFIENNHGRR